MEGSVGRCCEECEHENRTSIWVRESQGPSGALTETGDVGNSHVKAYYLASQLKKYNFKKKWGKGQEGGEAVRRLKSYISTEIHYRSHGLPAKHFSVRCGIPQLELLVRKVTEAPA